MKPDLRIVGSRSWRDETSLDQRPEPRYFHHPRFVVVPDPPRVPRAAVLAVAILLAAAGSVAWILFGS